jgi:hypothetical protein
MDNRGIRDASSHYAGQVLSLELVAFDAMVAHCSIRCTAAAMVSLAATTVHPVNACCGHAYQAQYHHRKEAKMVVTGANTVETLCFAARCCGAPRLSSTSPQLPQPAPDFATTLMLTPAAPAAPPQDLRAILTTACPVWLRVMGREATWAAYSSSWDPRRGADRFWMRELHRSVRSNSVLMSGSA